MARWKTAPRLLLEVADAVISVWGAEHVGVRLSPNGIYNDVGSPDFREQFLYAATELGQRKLGYLHIMDGLGFGFHKLGEPMTLKEFRAVFPGAIIGNVGYTKELAGERIASGDADLIAFGRPFITNPDLVERFEKNLPLAPSDDPTHWYSFGRGRLRGLPRPRRRGGLMRSALALGLPSCRTALY